MLFMKEQWGSLNRIRIGPEPPDINRSSLLDWCEDSIHGDWFHSENYECFYFRDHKDAIFFKLRWYDSSSKFHKGNY